LGKRGPLPKEEGARQNRRARSNLRLIEKYEADKPAVPQPPTGLSPERISDWHRYFGSQLAGLVQDTDMSAVRRLWGYYQQHDELTAIFAKSRLVAGSTGQPRMNPAADALLKLETAILRLENELGLTPSARLRLGITYADATNSLEKLTEYVMDLDDDYEEIWESDADAE
jgi:P27 family predicted phage terminase small subunit